MKYVIQYKKHFFSEFKNVKPRINSKRNRKNSQRKNQKQKEQKKIELEATNIISSDDENEIALFKMPCEEYYEYDYCDNNDDADLVDIYDGYL